MHLPEGKSERRQSHVLRYRIIESCRLEKNLIPLNPEVNLSTAESTRKPWSMVDAWESVGITWNRTVSGFWRETFSQWEHPVSIATCSDRFHCFCLWKLSGHLERALKNLAWPQSSPALTKRLDYRAWWSIFTPELPLDLTNRLQYYIFKGIFAHISGWEHF